jgi:predicted XRE-type DNA-binding protein
MTTELGCAHVTPSGGNVFADLGFPPEEAAALKAQSTAIIAAELAIKRQLMTEISAWMKQNNLNQAEAAQVLGVTRPRVSDLVNRRTVKFTIDALAEMLTRAGKR